ncbi:hypothetical protein [Mycobacteroides abscessus]|uniref:hypothetical protein n=1 Tax=Mycobacteroides abscessus TaxID=36809 RepID=UPI0009A696BF|nr:hypothetical protein [Mycobacteroides abscessus]SLH40802.1 Uncharacterised protein [Mycobacteroides abscessus subsp. massiliense]
MTSLDDAGAVEGYQLAAAHCANVRLELMEIALQQARAGQLAGDWRERIAAPQRLEGTAQPYLDGDALAVQEIKEMPKALWEPGVARTWREALDAWYLATREMLGSAAQSSIEALKVMRLSGLQGQIMIFRSRNTALSLTGAGGFAEYLSQKDQTEPQIDAHVLRILAGIGEMRDEIECSYRAGMAAGGDDIDWAQWMQERLTHWHDLDHVQHWRHRLQSGQGHSELEMLPDYWGGGPGIGDDNPGPESVTVGQLDVDAQHLATQHAGALRQGFLEPVLNQARHGQLAANWRDELAVPQPVTSTGQRQSDIDELIVRDLRESEVTPWEPGAANTWSEALDGWYCAMLEMECLAQSLAFDRYSWWQRVEVQFLRAALGGDIATRTDALAKAARRQRAFDDVMISEQTTRIMERDRAAASYRAGMAAGGDDVDWVAWMRDRISTWPPTASSETELGRLDDPTYREHHQQLPHYWTGVGR